MDVRQIIAATYRNIVERLNRSGDCQKSRAAFVYYVYSYADGDYVFAFK